VISPFLRRSAGPLPSGVPWSDGGWRGACLLGKRSLYSYRGSSSSFSSPVSSSRAPSGDGGGSGLSSAQTKLLLLVLLAFLIAEFAGEGRVLTRHCDGIDSVRCSFVSTCGSGVLLLGWMSISVQVSFLLLRATSVGLWEFFFRPLVVVLAAVDLVLADFGEEVADVRSMLKLRIDGGGGSPVLAAVNSGLASS
jgi:hypothetical protein